MSNRKRSNLGMMAPSGYQVPRSLRFRSSASAYLSRTPAGAGTSGVWTFSFWVKKSKATSDSTSFITSSQTANQQGNIGFGSDYFYALLFNTSGANCSWEARNGANQIQFCDPSAWYHLVVRAFSSSSGNSYGGIEVLIYINGVAQTTTKVQYNTPGTTDRLNDGQIKTIGADTINSQYLNGYLSEFYFIDGQSLAASYFGETSDTGQWIPKKYAGTYGTNGYYLDFSDNSALTSSSNVGLGKDSSGNANRWTTNNISVTAGVTYDSMLDVPGTAWVDGGNGRGNYCTGNPLSRHTTNTYNFTNGNLDVEIFDASNVLIQTRMTMGVSSGKWYWEATLVSYSVYQPSLGVAADNVLNGYYLGGTALQWGVYGPTGQKYHNGTSTAYGSAAAINDVVSIALDMDNGKIWFGKNGTWFASGDPAAGTNAAFTNLVGNTVLPAVGVGGSANSGGKYAFNFGQRPFTYTPPTGFKALHTGNLSAPTILLGNRYMDVETYTGTGATRTKTGLYFQPDLAWFKGRSGATDHALYDSVRGVQKDLASNTTAVETTQATGLTAFTSDGYTTGALAKLNTSAATYVNWLFKAGGTATNNTSGSITSSVSAGVAQGISVLTYTGTGTTATVGHGLGVAPKLIIIHARTGATRVWPVYHASKGAGGYGYLNQTNAWNTDTTGFNNTTPTSTVFSLGNNTDLNDTSNFVALCFTDVAGFSAFGSYVGNASTDGPFVHLGFRPRWVLIKGATVATSWVIYDSARNTYNVTNNALYPNGNYVEDTAPGDIDITANGFKLREGTGVSDNNNAETYIYAAFAESPFKYSNAR